MNKKYILSIDGGGIKGLAPLYFLLYLEEDLIKTTGKTIYETFDIFSGNSVGSILIGSIVYLLGPNSNYKTISDLIKAIFTDNNFREIFTINHNPLSKLLLRPKYNSQYKTNLLKKYLGNTKLIDTNKKVMFPLYSVSEQKPKFYKSYTFDTIINTDGKREESYDDISDVMDETPNKINRVLVRNIIDSSSAAPVYFSSVNYMSDDEEERICIDGAVFCNNPTDSILADAIRLYPNDKFVILSVGTGSQTFKKRSKETKKWGLVQWAVSGISDVILDSSEITADYRTKHFANALGHTYLRIQAPINIALDDISKIEELKLIGKEWYTTNKDQVLKLFDINVMI